MRCRPGISSRLFCISLYDRALSSTSWPALWSCCGSEIGPILGHEWIISVTLSSLPGDRTHGCCFQIDTQVHTSSTFWVIPGLVNYRERLDPSRELSPWATGGRQGVRRPARTPFQPAPQFPSCVFCHEVLECTLNSQFPSHVCF